MKIAIEALGINNYGGGRTAALNLLHGLMSTNQKHEYKIFLSQYEPSLHSDCSTVHQVISPTSNRFLQRLWAQIFIPPMIKDCDLIHYLKNLGLFGLKTKSIVTIHDLTTIHYPHLFPIIDVWYWKYIQKYSLQNMSKIIAVSHATALDLVHYYKINSEKITVIHNSISNIFKPLDAKEVNPIKKKYGLPDQYFIHVGRFDRKKNLALLVKAFASLTNYDGKLVLIGEECKKSVDKLLFSTIKKLGIQKKIVLLRRVPTQDLPAIYSGAQAAVLTSFHEGFGLFPVEALACGIPLIAHEASVMQEVIGDCAIILNDLSLKRLRSAMTNIIEDQELRKNLSRRGIAQVQQYKTTVNARDTLALYSKIINQAPVQ